MMTTFVIYYTVFILLIQLVSIHGSSRVNTKTNPKFPSVIKHLESSVAASTAHGTVVAIRALDRDCSSDEDARCIVIISRSPSTPTSQSNLTLSSIFEETEMNSSSIKSVRAIATTGLPRGPVSSKISGLQQHNDMLYTLHDSAVMAVTGLASDCKHLIKSAMMDISRYEYIYGSRTTSIPFVKTVLVDGLVSRVSRAAFSAEGRPFGVQILTVGKLRNRRENSIPPSDSPLLHIYTIDPSGALRKWKGKTVAIGRNSHVILQNLYKKINSKKDPTPSSSDEGSRQIYVQEAIQFAIQSMIESEEDDQLQYLTEMSNAALASSEFQIVIVSSDLKKRFVSKVNHIRQLYEHSILNLNLKHI